MVRRIKPKKLGENPSQSSSTCVITNFSRSHKGLQSVRISGLYTWNKHDYL